MQSMQELNIGGSLVTTALEEACGTNRLKIREMYNKFGDLGWMIALIIFGFLLNLFSL